MLDFCRILFVTLRGEYKCWTFTEGSLPPYEVNTSINCHRRMINALISYSFNDKYYE